MSRDSSHHHLHLRAPRIADLFEDFTRAPLAPEEIYVRPEHQPLNPEDEDDVVPDQHAAFGIQRATQKLREPAWRDLGLDELLRRGPTEPVRLPAAGKGSAAGTTAAVVRAATVGAGGMGVGAVYTPRANGGAGMPR